MSFPDFALHATPVNRVAGRVSFGESEAWEPKRKPTVTETFDNPPLAKMARPEASPDYSGFRRGRMVAFRYHESGKSGAKWLCRCDCGKYEIRRAAKWVKKPESPDCCIVCQATHFATHGFSFGDTRSPKERQAQWRPFSDAPANPAA